jgi:hypothetical protein
VVVKGLLWLAFLAAILLAAGVIFGWWKFRQTSTTS